MNKSMKRLCVLVASALSVANVNNSQAMKECNVQKFQYINNNFSNMLESEIENNNEINNTYDDHLEPSKNSLIRRNKFNEKDLIFEQVDSFEINSNDDDEIIYNGDYNKVLKSDDFEKNKEEYENWGHRKVNDSVITVSRGNGTAMEGYCPEPDKPEFTEEELEKMLKLSEEQSIIGQGDIEDRTGFPFDNFNINQSTINNESLPEYSNPDKITEYENNFDNNASMQNNTNLSNYAQVIRIPHTEEDAYVKCSAMTSKDFGKQLRNYNKNEYNRTVNDLVTLGNNPDFKVRYYSINLSEYPDPISVCFVARVYDNRNDSWTNYILCDSDEINKILYSFGNNDFIKKAIKDEINRLSYFGAKEINFYNLDLIKGVEFLHSDKLG